MDFLQNINAIWQKVGVVQRALLFGILMACIITAGLLTKWATKPEMRLLYGSLNPEEAGTIADKVSEKDIIYQLRSGGTSIYVPENHVMPLRISLAKEGLPQGGRDGYKLFDDEKIGVSPLVQQINYNRAIQDELAMTIQMIDGVEFARVHLVRPDQTMFTAESQNATASVVLRLKPGWQLNPASIVAITNLVAGAIDGVIAENVTIVNSKGQLLTSEASGNGVVTSANTFMDYKTKVEQIIAGKVQDMLEVALGPKRSTIKVSAEIDMTSIQTETTTYEKGQPSEEVVQSTSTTEGGGVTDDKGKQIGPSSTKKDETVENKYKVPETVTKRIDVPGKITSLSVSAIVDLSVPKPPSSGEGAEGETAPETETAMIMTVEEVTQIIRNAVGPELLKDEKSLSVVNVPFQRPVIIADDSGSYEKLSRYIEIARQSSMGVLAVCALVVLKIFTGAKKRASGGTAENQALSGQMAMLPAGISDDSTASYRHQISTALKQNPEQVKQLFTSWLSEGA